MTAAVSTQSLSEAQVVSQKRGCLFYVKRGLKWLGIVLVALVALGVGYQSIATEIDKRTYSPRGQLYTVNGHQMHLYCMGEGSPTVILEAGGAAESLWWFHIQNQTAQHTRVCAYDRPGLGFSEQTTLPRDPTTIVGELHTLLDTAGIPKPYIIVGHSYGAVLARINAAQYPDEVEGIVLVDGMPLEMDRRRFASQSDYEQAKQSFQTTAAVVLQVFDAATGLGLTRLLDLSLFESAGYPHDVAVELASLQARHQTVVVDDAEKGSGLWTLIDIAATAEDLGNLPTAILWAGASGTMQDVMTPYRDEAAGFSSNSVTRIVEGADHSSILGDEQYAQQVTDAILDVIEAAQTGAPLAA